MNLTGNTPCLEIATILAKDDLEGQPKISQILKIGQWIILDIWTNRERSFVD
jgi:hypothetical protein